MTNDTLLLIILFFSLTSYCIGWLSARNVQVKSKKVVINLNDPNWEKKYKTFKNK